MYTYALLSLFGFLKYVLQADVIRRVSFQLLSLTARTRTLTVLFASAMAATLGCRRFELSVTHRLSRSSLFVGMPDCCSTTMNHKLRRYASPRLLIPSNRSFPPELCCLSVSPSTAAIGLPSAYRAPNDAHHHTDVSRTVPSQGRPVLGGQCAIWIDLRH